MRMTLASKRCTSTGTEKMERKDLNERGHHGSSFQLAPNQACMLLAIPRKDRKFCSRLFQYKPWVLLWCTIPALGVAVRSGHLAMFRLSSGVLHASHRIRLVADPKEEEDGDWNVMRFLWPKKIIQTKWFGNPGVACPRYSNWWSQAFDWNQHGNTKAQQYFQKENADCPSQVAKSHQEPPGSCSISVFLTPRLLSF